MRVQVRVRVRAMGLADVSVGAQGPRVAQDGQQATPPVGCQLLGLIVWVNNGDKLLQWRKYTLTYPLLQLGELLEGCNRAAGPMPPRATLVARIDQ